MAKRFSECPESITGHDAGGTTDGTCTWCGRQINARPLRPTLPGFEPSDLREAYDYYHDPDYGVLSRDEIAERYRMGQES